MTTAIATRKTVSRIKLADGKMISRVVRNVLDMGNGFFEGYISISGQSVRVERKKHSRNWQEVQ